MARGHWRQTRVRRRVRPRPRLLRHWNRFLRLDPTRRPTGRRDFRRRRCSMLRQPLSRLPRRTRPASSRSRRSPRPRRRARRAMIRSSPVCSPGGPTRRRRRRRPSTRTTTRPTFARPRANGPSQAPSRGWRLPANRPAGHPASPSTRRCARSRGRGPRKFRSATRPSVSRARRASRTISRLI